MNLVFNCANIITIFAESEITEKGFWSQFHKCNCIFKEFELELKNISKINFEAHQKTGMSLKKKEKMKAGIEPLSNHEQWYL